MRLLQDNPWEGVSVRVVVWTAGLLAVMGLVTGCSSKCEAVCGEANACTVKERGVDVDCPEYCADVEKFNERAVAAGQQSCDAAFQKHLDCWDSNSKSICDAEFSGCADAQKEFSDCMTAYCEAVAAAKATDPKATDPNCIFEEDDDGNLIGYPALAPF
jgi:hypothetical protein